MDVMWGYELNRPGSGEGQVADTCECGTFGFHKMRGIPRLAENRLASQEGQCSME